MPTYLEIAARPSTIHAAFLKARTWCWEQPYYDTVEVKLFEWRLQRNMAELGRRLKSGYRFQPILAYYLPKDQKAARKFAYRSFFDEVATTAAALAIGRRMERDMDRGGPVSFGNRLDLAPHSDRLFIPWSTAWERFSRACGRAARSAPWFVRTDVKNFYPEIPRDRLHGILQHVLPHDPILPFFHRLIEQPCPLIGDRGIPAGPAISGFLANLYLLPLDRTVRQGWKAGARFRRYVDDIFYFTRTRGGAARSFRMLSATARDRFGLRLHAGKKLEIGYSRDPLRRGSSPPNWVAAEQLFDRVFSSLYRFDAKLRGRFRREPDRLLKWYAIGLRHLGFHVSTDWLAQRILTVQAKGRSSRWLAAHGGYRLDIPDVELFEIEKHGMRGWARDFAQRNRSFMRDAARLHRTLRGMTLEAYRELGDVNRQSKGEMKGRLYRLRNFAARLAMMRCHRTQNVFNMLIDHPWIMDPALSINAFLSYPNAFEKLRDILFSDRAEIVRAKAAWALGELGDSRAVRALWEAGKHGRGETMRRSALEALLRIDRWRDIPADWVMGEARHQPVAALRKYYILMLGRIRPHDAGDFLREAAARETDPVCRLAIEFAASDTHSLYHVAGELRRSQPAAVAVFHPAERR